MRYRGLGPLELRRGDTWTGIGPAKWRTLLAVLLCEAGQIVTVDRLIDELWGDRAPATANKLLQGYVAKLRLLMDVDESEKLVTVKSGYRAQGYRLLVEDGELDVGVFERLVADGRLKVGAGDVEGGAVAFGEALELWRGRPFADVPAVPMVRAEIDRLEERRLQVIEEWVEANLRCGRHAALVTEPETLVAAHPLRERLRGQMMVALYNVGRQADALRAYHDVRVTLAEELGVDPGAELQDLYQRMLSADPALLGGAARPAREVRAGIPRRLPRSTGVFTGRHDELGRLAAILNGGEGGAVVISAIDGIGGVGKSALAIHAAHDHDHAVDWLEAERSNLVHAVILAAGQPDRVARLGTWLGPVLSWFFYACGYGGDQETVQTTTIRIAHRLNDLEAQASALDTLSASYETSGQYDKARSFIEHAILIWRELGNRNSEQRGLCRLANNLIQAGRSYDDAIDLLKRQIRMATDIGNDVAAAIGMGNLGRAYLGLGRTDDALRWLFECLESARALGDSWTAGWASCDIGAIYLDNRCFGEARAHFEEGLRPSDVAGDKLKRARYLPVLGRACRELGDLDGALRYAQDGLELSQEIDDRPGETAALLELDEILRASHRL